MIVDTFATSWNHSEKFGFICEIGTVGESEGEFVGKSVGLGEGFEVIGESVGSDDGVEVGDLLGFLEGSFSKLQRFLFVTVFK